MHSPRLDFSGASDERNVRVTEIEAITLARRAPSPRRGEGWGEGVRKFEKILQYPNPLTLARCARSTSPLRGEVKKSASASSVIENGEL
jgi:hypothetical protein